MKFGKDLLRIVVLVSVLLTLSRMGASFPCGQLCEGRRF